MVFEGCEGYPCMIFDLLSLIMPPFSQKFISKGANITCYPHFMHALQRNKC